MPAPPPMQFAALQYAKPDQANSVAKQMQGLGTALDQSGLTKNKTADVPAVAPGAAVQGGAGPISAGGPMGQAPLPGQQALPGSPYSPQAGPVAPPQGAPPPPPPLQNVAPPVTQTPGQPQQPQQPSPLTQYLQNMPPLQALGVLKAMTGQGMSVMPPSGLPGSTAMQSAQLGMLPASAGFPGAPQATPAAPPFVFGGT